VTVAAVVLFARVEGAIADAAGRAAVRRIVESAWAGGATPIVIVSADPEGAVAAALAGSPAVLAEPAPADQGPVGQIARGMRVAAEHVRDTDACLIWPGRMAWVDAETITSLIEAHGASRSAVLRPRYESSIGWPALLPLDLVDRLSGPTTGMMPDELLAQLATAGVELVPIDTGDPGVVHDITTPLDSLPQYQGPSQPVAGHAPEWGAAAADLSDDVPLQGPSLAPFSQASQETD
jgi:CTP:molybdopterin cytidylyltransferase MocA